MPKKVLIIYAHMEPASFNAAMLDVAVNTLKELGHEVVVSDLYAMKFNPVISRQDKIGERYLILMFHGLLIQKKNLLNTSTIDQHFLWR